MEDRTENLPGCTSTDCVLMRWALILLYLILVSLVWNRLYGLAREADSPFVATLDALGWADIPLVFGALWYAGAFRRAKPSAEPDLPSLETTVLYRFYADDGELLYAGITQEPERRMRRHSQDKPWWPEVVTTETRAYRTRDDAARAEHAVIMRENPRYNVARYSLEAHLRSQGAR